MIGDRNYFDKTIKDVKDILSKRRKKLTKIRKEDVIFNRRVRLISELILLGIFSMPIITSAGQIAGFYLMLYLGFI